jgi:hypothetical protein
MRYRTILTPALLLALACSSSTDPMPDFVLLDVNPDSASHEDPVSPRDYLGHVTGWYFGSTT